MMLRRVLSSSLASRSLRAVAPRGRVSAFSRTPFGGDSMQKSWLSALIDIPPAPTSHHKHHKLEGSQGSIIYTETDEAPALATYCLYPVISKVRRWNLTYSSFPSNFIIYTMSVLTRSL
jgi:hypothetical protein